MEPLNRTTHTTQPLPIRILQFGEGNFLRAFVEWFIHQMNVHHEYGSGVAVVQPIQHGMVQVLGEQDGLYHHVVQGLERGETVDEVVLNESVQQTINPFEHPEEFFALATSPDLRLIFSNTTEAGIQFDAEDRPEQGGLASTFPGKLLQFLHRRFEALGDSEAAALGIVPCELIEENGRKLRDCLLQYAALWEMPQAFHVWIGQRLHFANTLVDRIVPGYPREEIEAITDRIGINDRLVVKSESFHLFVIEGDSFIQTHFPADRYGFNVKYVESITPFRTQKVRILNGAHTSMVPVGMLAGIETVRETVEDEVVGTFVRDLIFDEVVRTIAVPGEDPGAFAEEVLMRFANPFIRHELIAISLNSVSKWRVRVLPTVLDFVANEGKIPKRLVFSLAALVQLHLSGKHELRDDADVLSFFEELGSLNLEATALADRVLGQRSFWGQDLREIEGMKESVATCIDLMNNFSIKKALSKL